MATEDELSARTHEIYLYLVKADSSRGPRDVMHDLQLSSPAVAFRGLQKLLDLGLVGKDAYGRYTIKEKVGFKGFFWVGKNLFHRLLLFGFFFLGLLIPQCVVLYLRWMAQQSLEAYIVSSIITAFAMSIFFFEGMQLQRNVSKIIK